MTLVADVCFRPIADIRPSLRNGAMRFIDWDEKDVGGLSKSGLFRLVAEIDDDGVVTRELGFDVQHRLVHRCPGGVGVEGTYGFFDLQRFAPGDHSDLAEEEFDRLWALPDHPMEKRSHRRPWLGLLILFAALLAVAALVTLH